MHEAAHQWSQLVMDFLEDLVASTVISRNMFMGLQNAQESPNTKRRSSVYEMVVGLTDSTASLVGWECHKCVDQSQEGATRQRLGEDFFDFDSTGVGIYMMVILWDSFFLRKLARS